MELIKNASSPEFWQKVQKSDAYRMHRERLAELWKADCQEPIDALTYSDFRRFFVDGNRSVYEARYFRRRRAMNTSALLSLIYPEKEEYLVRLMDEIYAICDEYTWCLPAHQETLEVNDNANLDIFACETGFTLAEICTILGKRLEPLICNRIRAEIDRRIINSFDQKIWHWERQNENWNAVCTTSVACAVMLMRPELMGKYKARFDAAAECYLAGFKEDGICEEGVGYWNYGFGFFTVYADMIRTFTNGETDYFVRPHVKKIATFMQKCNLSGETVISFSDGSRRESSFLALLHYLKNEYPDEIRLLDRSCTHFDDNCGRWCLHLRSFTWFLEEDAQSAGESEDAVYFAENAQWFIRKTARYGFATKGGTNKEPHNHNDIGTFILAKDGRQVISDIGSGVYTRQYFKKETRYDHFHCSSRGHNLPMIGEALQQFGEEYRAKNFLYENGALSMDIAGAYGLDSLKSLVREFSFTEQTVTMTDTFDYSGEGVLTERLIMLEKPVLVSQGSIVVDGVTLNYDPALCDVSFGEEIDRECRVSKDPIVYTVDLTLKKGVDRFVLTMTV